MCGLVYIHLVYRCLIFSSVSFIFSGRKCWSMPRLWAIFEFFFASRSYFTYSLYVVVEWTVTYFQIIYLLAGIILIAFSVTELRAFGFLFFNTAFLLTSLGNSLLPLSSLIPRNHDNGFFYNMDEQETTASGLRSPHFPSSLFSL